MESLKSKALFIVEGAKGEVNLVKRISQLFKMDIEFVSVCANIHMLYQKLKKDDFNVDIVKVLLESDEVKESDKDKIRNNNSFAYTYLIFDLDLQHYNLAHSENLSLGLDEVIEMLSHFQNETDGTIGKLYINYPMLESYRDCKKFYEDSYREKAVKIDCLKNYKKIVGERGNSVNLSSYSEQNFIDLCRMNLAKANYLCKKTWEKPAYEIYLNELTQSDIASTQAKMIKEEQIINVLNCSLFFVVDYFGNKDGAFDKI